MLKMKMLIKLKKSIQKLPGRLKSAVQKNESGQALLELAVGMIVLLVMLAGIIDLGRMSFYYFAMRDGAQEGAIYGSVNPTHCIQIEDRAYANLWDMGSVTVVVEIIDETNNITYACADAIPHTEAACIGNTIEVTITDTDFPLTMPFIGTFLGKQAINLQATVTNTILRPICVSP